MNEKAVPVRLTIAWSVQAQSDLRAIDRSTALDILHCVDRFLSTRSGDVKTLKPPFSDSRLRCGDYRIFFKQNDPTGISVTRVKHRRFAYRQL